MKKFEQLKEAINTYDKLYTKHSDDPVFIGGLTSHFDKIFELVWKTLKEYLQQDLGIRDAITGSPKVILALAYKENLIQNPDVWLAMLKDRNDMTHHYNESDARSYVARIERIYISCIRGEVLFLNTLIEEEPDVITKIPEEFMGMYKSSNKYFDIFLSEVLEHTGAISDVDLFTNWSKYRSILQESMSNLDNICEFE